MKNIYSFTIKQPLSALLAKNAKLIVIMTLVIGAWGQGAWGQASGDLHTKASGNWDAIGTWERYNGTSWESNNLNDGSFTSGWTNVQVGGTNAFSPQIAGGNSLNMVQISGISQAWYYKAVTLTAGVTYSLSFDYIASTSGASDKRIGIAIHSSAPTSGMTVNTGYTGATYFFNSTVTSTSWITRGIGQTGYLNDFTPSSSGTYYLAIGANQTTATTLSFDNIILSVAAPSFSSAAVTVLSGHTVTINTDLTIDQTTIDNGGKVTLAGGTLTINNGSGNDLTVNGIYERTASATTMTINSGALVIVGNGGAYEHNVASGGSLPAVTWNTGSTLRVTGGPTTIPTLSGTYQNFEWNCPSQTTALSLAGALTTVIGDLRITSTGTGAGALSLGNASTNNLTVGGNFYQTGGAFELSASAARTMTVTGDFSFSGGAFDLSSSSTAGNASILNVAGNFTHTAGTITETGSTTGSKIVFNGVGAQQTIESSGLTNTLVFDLNGTSSNKAIVAAGKTFLLNKAFTVFSGNTLEIASTGNFTVSATLTNNGTTNVNGAFQLNTSGYAAGTNFIYGSSGTLSFNSSTTYGVENTHVYWPITSGPVNVTVLQGGLTLGASVQANRTVSGIFQTAAAVTLSNSSVLTINGTCQINANGSFNLAPTYGNSSTLIYNTVSNFAASQEWYPNNSGTGPGVPQNVTIASGTSLNFGSSNAYRLMRGNLNFSTPYPATSTLALSTTAGGDLYIGGNWNKASGGTFAPNGRLVKFNGSGSQTITSSGGETFAYLEVNNSSGAVMANNVTLNNTLTLNSGKLAIGANTLTLSGAVASMSAANSLTGSASSNLTLNGSGTLGSLYFDQTASGTTNALQNLTINRPSITVALGNSLLVGGTLTLTDGTLSGPLAFGANGILTYNGTGYSTSSDVEFPASSGPKDVNITVANSSGLTLHANRTIAGNLSIASGQKFIIPTDKQLSVTGTLTNTATATGLIIESGASLKNNTAGVAATVKRNIPAWGSVMVGWHLLSSPVSSQAFQPEFVPTTPTANEDFYLWNLTNNYWINSKVGAGTIPDPFTFNSTDFGTTFNVGKGYLASYGSDQNKVFAGTLNSGDVTNVALTYASTGAYSGFNLLGNPYPCGLIWGSWATGDAHISATAKILLSANGSYDDISAGGFIPAMNGFFVKTDANTTLTIPASAKDHGGTWLKSAQEVPSFMLTANDLDGQTAQRSHFSINPESTAGFDMKYDGEFMPLYAPEFYSVVGENKLSTNTIPEITDGMVIPMGFVKNGGTNFSIQASDIASLQPASAVYLWDNKTGIKQNLSDNPVYSFTSAEGDAPARFELHFNSSTSFPEATTPETFTVYQSNGMIRISTQQSAKAEILVTNMLGQVVLRCQTHGNSLTTLDVEQLQNGVYVVSLVGGNKVESRKIVVRK